jgi:hypothetical protein
VPAGRGLTVHVHYAHSEPLRDPYFGLTFETVTGLKVFWAQTRLQHGRFPDLPPSGVVACHFPRIPLVPGRYYITSGCGSGTTQLDHVHRGCVLQVTEADVFGTGRMPPPHLAVVLVDAEWEVASALEPAAQ